MIIGGAKDNWDRRTVAVACPPLLRAGVSRRVGFAFPVPTWNGAGQARRAGHHMLQKAWGIKSGLTRHGLG